MEETLTDCLVRVREDLSQLQKVRDYLETNAETEEHCSFTWRTIEAFNSILSVCNSQNSPETPALDTLLDSFFYLAKNNNDNNVWEDFGFELGIICVKVLSAIEKTKIFETLFYKLLSIINILCQYNGDIWKATARQILNVLINKKITLFNLENIVKKYICILRRIDNDALREFSSQNFHLLKTLSLLVKKIGDFEIQSYVTELIYLHLSKDSKLMLEIFEKEHFTDFENDCRLYLNSLNKSCRGCDSKVTSICCHVLYLGRCFVEPPVGKNFIWVDANKDTERLSIKFCDSESEGNRVLYVPFSKILKIQFENEKTEGNLCLTIKTRNLEIQEDEVGDIYLVTGNAEVVYEFVRFLEMEITGRKKKKKTSKTMDLLVINRSTPHTQNKVRGSAITNSERPGTNQILPDVLSLFEKADENPKDVKTSQTSQELSPNSFIESLNKHIGMPSPELRQTFEDSIETIEFLQKSTPGRSHKLFRSPSKVFNVSEDFNFVFGENKENQSEMKIKTYSRKSMSVLKDRQNLEGSQSQDCFRGSSVLKKRPFLPKLKRSRTTSKNKETEQKKESKTKQLDKQIIQREQPKKQETVPSLLDPNGYAYQRWCKPTTSERSNFWLKKLESLQKTKSDPENVFEFSEGSDSIFGKKKKRRVVHSKRKCKTRKEAKGTSLRQAKEILKKASPITEKETPKNSPQNICRYQNSPAKTSEVLPFQESPKRVETPETVHHSEYESIPSSDDEKPLQQNKKRDLSEEETSSMRGLIKKKPKISLPKNILLSIRRRLEKVEEKDKRYTSEIIRTVDKGINHLFNYLQRKDGEMMLSYLKTAEIVSTNFENEFEDLNLKSKRIQRVILYLQAGCSVGEFCDFLDDNFSKVREGLRILKKKNNNEKNIDRICERLSGLIVTEIEKSLKAEWVLKQNSLLKFTSIIES